MFEEKALKEKVKLVGSTSIVYSLLVCPLDVIITRKQSVPSVVKIIRGDRQLRKVFSFAKASNFRHAQKLYVKDGILGLYRGFLPLTAYTVINGTIYSYLVRKEKSPFTLAIQYLLLLSFTQPLLVFKNQYVIESLLHQPVRENITPLIHQNMIKSRTFLSGIIPLFIYNEFGQRITTDKVPKTFSDFIQPFIIGTSSLFAFYPFYTISTNQQILAISKEKRSFVRTTKLIFETSGWQGFYAGFGLHIAKIFPMITIFGGLMGMSLTQDKLYDKACKGEKIFQRKNKNNKL